MTLTCHRLSLHRSEPEDRRSFLLVTITVAGSYPLPSKTALNVDLPLVPCTEMTQNGLIYHQNVLIYRLVTNGRIRYVLVTIRTISANSTGFRDDENFTLHPRHQRQTKRCQKYPLTLCISLNFALKYFDLCLES